MIRNTLWIGTVLLVFSGCAEVPVAENAAPAATTAASSVKLKNQAEMISYCKGMIAGEAGTKPMYVKMGSVERSDGSTFVAGTVDGIRYTCQFDSGNSFVSVGKFAD